MKEKNKNMSGEYCNDLVCTGKVLCDECQEALNICEGLL